MNKGAVYLRVMYKHVVPYAMALRLITFTSAGSLAAAATKLPQVEGPQPIATVLPSTPQAPVITLQQFLTETNDARQANGEPPLHLNDQLDAAAAAKAEDMVVNHYWDHYSPTGKAPWDFIKEAGYTYHYAGENLARGFRTAHGIILAWLASPAHRANLLSPHYVDVGFATSVTQDANGQPILLTVQLFGAQ